LFQKVVISEVSKGKREENQRSLEKKNIEFIRLQW
jgi:hypothetical protein